MLENSQGDSKAIQELTLDLNIFTFPSISYSACSIVKTK